MISFARIVSEKLKFVISAFYSPRVIAGEGSCTLVVVGTAGVGVWICVWTVADAAGPSRVESCKTRRGCCGCAIVVGVFVVTGCTVRNPGLLRRARARAENVIEDWLNQTQQKKLP